MAKKRSCFCTVAITVSTQLLEMPKTTLILYESSCYASHMAILNLPVFPATIGHLF